MSSSAKIDDREKDILILGKSPIQVLEHTLTAQKLYSINFTENNKIFFLSFHYNGGNNYLFVNGTQIIKFKAKDSEFSVDNRKKNRIKWILALITMLLQLMIRQTFVGV